MDDAGTVRRPMIVPPGEGRLYPMGRMQAIFKADCAETADRCSVSEWWLEPRTRGPGEPHRHEEDHVFYVIVGTLSLRLDNDWADLPAGAYAVIPGGTPHTFENRSSIATGFISFNAPGGFEARLQDIAAALSAEDLRL